MPVRADALVPVPLHPKQMHRSGYNQSLLLAEEVGRRLGLPVWAKAPRRSQPGHTQVSLASRAERWANMADAFQADEGLSGRALVLVDDVMTTGSTLHSGAATLKAAGASSVWGLVAARET